jgi:collagen type III alpha
MSPTATADQNSSSRYVGFDEYVELQLQRTTQQIRSTDVLLASTVAAVIVLSYLLLFVVADSWLFPQGLPWVVRSIGFALWSIGLVVWLGWSFRGPLLFQINRLFAARELERFDPNLRGSLLTLVDLQTSGRPVDADVLRAIERRAARELAEVDVSHAVDHRPLVRSGVALLTVVVLCCGYLLWTPKRIGPSLWRVLPVADLSPPTRTEILNVTPGDTEVFARSMPEITVELGGSLPETAQLLFTTADQRLRDEVVTLRSDGAGGVRYKGLLSGEQGQGLLQDVTYRIVAGDARSRDYHIRVDRPPSARITELIVTPPPYTELPAETLSSGTFTAWEGSRVRLVAEVNQPVKSAVLQFLNEPQGSPTGEEEAVQVQQNGQQLVASWDVRLRDDGTYPKYYRIQCQTAAGRKDPAPIVHQYTIRRDQPPEVALVDPQQDLTVPANAKIPLLIVARDPDFRLGPVTLHLSRESQEIHRAFLSPGEPAELRLQHVLDLGPLQLAPGQELLLHIEAQDNRLPRRNRTKTLPIALKIEAPASTQQIDEQLAQAQDRQSEALQQPANPDNAMDEEPADSGSSGDSSLAQQEPGSQAEGENADAPADPAMTDASNESESGEGAPSNGAPSTASNGSGESTDGSSAPATGSSRSGSKTARSNESTPEQSPSENTDSPTPSSDRTGSSSGSSGDGNRTTPTKTGARSPSASDPPNAGPDSSSQPMSEQTKGSQPASAQRPPDTGNRSVTDSPKSNSQGSQEPGATESSETSPGADRRPLDPSGADDQAALERLLNRLNQQKTPSTQPNNSSDSPGQSQAAPPSEPNASEPSDSGQPGPQQSGKKPSSPQDRPSNKPGAAGKTPMPSTDEKDPSDPSAAPPADPMGQPPGTAQPNRTAPPKPEPSKPGTDMPTAGDNRPQPVNASDQPMPESSPSANDSSTPNPDGQPNGDSSAAPPGQPQTGRSDRQQTRDAPDGANELDGTDPQKPQKQRADQPQGGERGGSQQSDQGNSGETSEGPGSPSPGGKSPRQPSSKPTGSPASGSQPSGSSGSGSKGSSKPSSSSQQSPSESGSDPSNSETSASSPGESNSSPSGSESPSNSSGKPSAPKPSSAGQRGNPKQTDQRSADQGTPSGDQPSDSADSNMNDTNDAAVTPSDSPTSQPNESQPGNPRPNTKPPRSAGNDRTARSGSDLDQQPGEGDTKNAAMPPEDASADPSSTKNAKPPQEGDSSKKPATRAERAPSAEGADETSRDPSESPSENPSGAGDETAADPKDAAPRSQKKPTSPEKSQDRPAAPPQGQDPAGEKPSQGANDQGGSKPNQGGKPSGGGGESGGKPESSEGGASSGKPSSAQPADPRGASGAAGKQSVGASGGGGQVGDVRPGPGNGEGIAPTDSPTNAGPAEAAKLEHQKQATDLVLKQLQNDLERGEVDPQLLDDLGWNQDDLQRFVDRVNQQLLSSDETATPESAARRLQFEEMLKSLPTAGQSAEQRGSAEPDRSVEQIDARRAPVPKEYRKAYEMYTRKLAQPTSSKPASTTPAAAKPGSAGAKATPSGRPSPSSRTTPAPLSR